MTTEPKRIVILISGRGSNMGALISATLDPAYPARIVGVISNKADATGLKAAEDFGIATQVISHKDYDDRASHDEAISAAIEQMNADFICLAGYMRLLTAAFVSRWQGKLLNIHPALLPSFKGIDTHARALSAGVRVHGATVHFVTEDMDDGPIIAQGAVPVGLKDTEATLADRVLEVEHRLYPLALRLVAEGKVTMRDGTTLYSNMNESDEKALLLPVGRSRETSDQP
ncbi:phosphoribosylglycinamide formyltransferase [Notoacmeibacter sp. MSK16QG-6]|uniref:phosphoribosylglycinamide formyltransferase n=1 Tax=Notoacmeibacter sp. MSK16QG-6 TaxID=2957982 RepID=UPI0020A119F3|nr:phosphoribosylglycinamide formyltransferase [Notoacmeibacter sp. MSK16QG-6]MCP1197954.1 phosphoribosylglycinamide formyltransferase [Notoacmeibacter sp. MSK16QG-6]